MGEVGVTGDPVAAHPAGGDHLDDVWQPAQVGQAQVELQRVGEVGRPRRARARRNRLADAGDGAVGDGGNAGAVQQRRNDAAVAADVAGREHRPDVDIAHPAAIEQVPLRVRRRRRTAGRTQVADRVMAGKRDHRGERRDDAAGGASRRGADLHGVVGDIGAGQLGLLPGVQRLEQEVDHAGGIGAGGHGAGHHQPDLEGSGLRLSQHHYREDLNEQARPEAGGLFPRLERRGRKTKMQDNKKRREQLATGLTQQDPQAASLNRPAWHRPPPASQAARSVGRRAAARGDRACDRERPRYLACRRADGQSRHRELHRRAVVAARPEPRASTRPSS